MKIFTIFIGLALGLTLGNCGDQKGGHKQSDSRHAAFKLKQFKDCDELQTNVYRQLKAKHKRETANDQGSEQNDAVANGQAKSSSAPAESFTNVQDKGVDEPDYTKIGEHHIFTVNGKDVIVVDRKSLKQMDRLTFSTASLHLFTAENKLIVIQADENTDVSIYDLAADEKPSLSRREKFIGKYKDSRYTSNFLFMELAGEVALKANVKTWPDFEVPRKPVATDTQKKVSGVSCRDITKPFIDDADLRLTTIVSFDAHSDAKPKIIGVLGGGDNTYMSTEALYITKYQSDFVFDDILVGAEENKKEFKERLIISKITFSKEDGDIALVAVGDVKGRAKDQWAFKDFSDEGALAVATTSGMLWESGENAASNHLWILKQDGKKLLPVASVENFGRKEDIRAVRYIDRMAYVVTFKKTDPLFAIDLANLNAPKIVDELKIPGFSTYLHPISNKQLIGVGFDAADQGDFAYYQGIQISLFDNSDPTDLKVRKQSVFGGRGSSSEVTGDHHAFFMDEEEGIFGLPIVMLEKADPSTPFAYANEIEFSGALLFKLSKDSFQEIARISHSDWLPEKCRAMLNTGVWWSNAGRSLDISRLYKVDDRLLSISRFGIKAHATGNPSKELGAFAFDDLGKDDCLR